MRILLLTTTLRRGGTERHVVRVARGLAARGHDLTVACLEPIGPLARELHHDSIPTIGFGARHPLATPRTTLALARLYRGFEPDVVVSYLFHANVIGALAAGVRGFGAALPARVTSLRTGAHRRGWHARLERWAAAGAARVLCVSEPVRAYAVEELGVDAQRLVVIANGVELPPEAPPPADDGPWISVTRLAPDKRVRELVRAWKHLARTVHPVPRLEVVGDGPLRGALEAEAAGLPIRFLGVRDDVPALLARSRGFVFAASPVEGCPNALCEAFAHARPVAVTAGGGVNDHVRHGENALTAPVGDAVVLAERVATLDRDAALRRRLGAAAYRYACDVLSIDAMLDAYEALFAEIVDGDAARG